MARVEVVALRYQLHTTKEFLDTTIVRVEVGWKWKAQRTFGGCEEIQRRDWLEKV